MTQIMLQFHKSLSTPIMSCNTYNLWKHNPLLSTENKIIKIKSERKSDKSGLD